MSHGHHQGASEVRLHPVPCGRPHGAAEQREEAGEGAREQEPAAAGIGGRPRCERLRPGRFPKTVEAFRDKANEELNKTALHSKIHHKKTLHKVDTN